MTGYLGWFDDGKKPTQQKIEDAVKAYTERYGIAPNSIYVNAAELVEVEGVAVVVRPWIRRHNYGASAEVV